MKNILLTLSIITLMMMAGCGTATSDHNNTALNYDNESQFEEALNEGADVTGSMVTFTAGLTDPGSPYGYVVYSGKKLFFCSTNNPGIAPGSTVTVKVISAKNIENNWIIEYER